MILVNIYEVTEKIRSKNKKLTSSQFKGLLIDYCVDTLEIRELAFKIGIIISKYKIFEFVKKKPTEEQIIAFYQAAKILGDDQSDLKMAIDIVSIYTGINVIESQTTEVETKINNDDITILDDLKKLYNTNDFIYSGTSLNFFPNLDKIIVSIITGDWKIELNGKYDYLFPYSYLLSDGTMFLGRNFGLLNKFTIDAFNISYKLEKNEGYIFHSGSFIGETFKFAVITNYANIIVGEFNKNKSCISNNLMDYLKIQKNTTNIETVWDVLVNNSSIYIATNDSLIKTESLYSKKRLDFYDSEVRKNNTKTIKSGFIQNTWIGHENYYIELTSSNLLYILKLNSETLKRFSLKLDISKEPFVGFGTTKYVLFARHNIYIIDEKGSMLGDFYLVEEAKIVNLNLQENEIVYGVSDAVLAGSLITHISTSHRVIYIRNYEVMNSYYDDHRSASENQYLLNRILSYGYGYLMESVK